MEYELIIDLLGCLTGCFLGEILYNVFDRILSVKRKRKKRNLKTDIENKD